MTEIQVGSILRGFCGGYFGRDSYVNKRVEAIGADWVVAREIEREDAIPEFATDPNILEILKEYL